MFLALLVSIILAGFNSGNNLLYLIACVMLGCVFVSLVAGRINLSRLEVRRRLPTYVFAGHPFRTRLEIFNNKKLFHSFGIYLEGAAGGDGHLFFVSIGNEGSQAREAEVVLIRRGLQKFSPMILSSKFPWGLFNLRKKTSDRQEVIVYPHIYDLGRMVPGSGHIRDEFPQHLKGPGSGLYGVREYRHGEDAANICWKLSAKLDRLIVRETEREEKRRVCIVFDNTLKEHSREALDAFERAVSAAASLVWFLCRNGYSVKLVTRGKVVAYGDGLDHMHRMLIALALIEVAAPDDEGLSVDKRLFEGGTGVLVGCADGAAEIRSVGGDFALAIPERTWVDKA
jgi:uncharacterized protein (DUF58 family)